MTQLNVTITTLLVRYAKGEVSPEEKRQLDAWASLSATNRSWLEQIDDPEWRQKRSSRAIDLEERSKTFWALVAEQEPPPPVGQPAILTRMVTARWLTKAAVAILIISAGLLYLLLPTRNKITLTDALFNKTRVTPPVGNSTPAPAAITITDYESNRPPAVDNKLIDKKIKTRAAVVVTPTLGEEDTLKTVYSNRILAPDKPVYSHTANGEAVVAPKSISLWVPATGYSLITLPDGSLVWRNAMTRISYPPVFTGDKRRVELTGEAYFEVVPNDTSLFVVAIDGVELETTGGRFQVNAYENEPAKKITVLQGAVTVATGPHAITVHDNQMAVVTKNITVVPNADTLRATAWKEKRFLYKQDSGAVVMRDLARRFDLIIAGPVNSDLRISYSGPWTDTAQETLAAIQRANKAFHYKLTGRKLTLQ